MLVNDSNASISATTPEYEKFDCDVKLRVYIILKYVGIVSTIVAFGYAILSWCFLKNFRNFKNYVLASAIFANVLRFALLEAGSTSPFELRESREWTFAYWSIMYYLLIANQCWILVLSYIFYVEFVQVLHLDSRRKILISTVFAWGGSLLAVLIIIFLGFLVNFLSHPGENIFYINFLVASSMYLIIPTTISLVMYIKVLCSLGSKSKTEERLGRFVIATFIFILSNMSLLYLLSILEISPAVSIIMRFLVEYFNTLAVNIYIIVSTLHIIKLLKVFFQIINKKVVNNDTEVKKINSVDCERTSLSCLIPINNRTDIYLL